MSEPTPSAAASSAPSPAASTSTPAPTQAIAPTDNAHPLATPADMQEVNAIAAPGSADERRSAEGGISAPTEPKVHLRALIISGQSHMFSFEPELTVGRVKELIWSMWPSEWSSPAQPPSPAFLRVLYAGRILQDDSTLASNNMPVSVSPLAPTVIHISVRSFSIRAEDDPKKANLHTTTSRTGRPQDNEVGGCKCIIM